MSKALLLQLHHASSDIAGKLHQVTRGEHGERRRGNGFVEAVVW